MLVYGDAAEVADPRRRVAGLRERLAGIARLPPGIERHTGLVAALIEAGALLQGLADAAFADRGLDERSPVQDRLMTWLVALADAVRRSWTSGFAACDAPAPASLAWLEAAALPGRVEIKRPEGYAFYALYPEAYLAAAASLAGHDVSRVVGIRSIGTSLSAVVAAALGAPAPLTVRPTGHPFDRRLALGPELMDGLAPTNGGLVAVVDEGPGLSGSSFGAVADHLERLGLPQDRIVFFPSHGNDLGPQASARHRARWRTARRPVVEFDALALDAADPAHRIERWVEDLTGPALAPLEDLSAGRWRALRYPVGSAWPPAHLQQERRKFLLRTASGSWLLKFAGLGPDGEGKLAMAKALHAEGFVPEAVGLRHGFLVERWLGDARPVEVAGRSRAALIDTVGRYLACRARRFPARPEDGASADRLLAMARHNTAEALGADAAEAFDRFAAALPGLEARMRRIRTDNRLQAWEWLATAEERILKADALDHHAAHDLIGCQDVAWDVAGAVVELDLDSDEERRLAGTVERATGRPVASDLVAFLLPSYLAFQLGHATMAAEALAWDPVEAGRLKASAAFYAGRLARWAHAAA